ncbi:MAG: SurA N-terminal domain-containing protein [Desulforhopalus sp.]|nr:SurA N-terminal domain-containing protein [Desulforhopalus sp.]
MTRPTTNRQFSRFLGGIFAIFLVVLLFPVIGRAEVVDKVVAVVNDDVITLSELEEEMARIYQILAKESSGQALVNSMNEAREATINSMIDRRLINQRAKSTNTTVSDEELEAAFNTTRNRMALDPTEFKKKLDRSGLTEETLKKQLRDQVLQSKLVSYDVRAKIVITEEMIRDYYNEHFSTKIDKDSYYLLQMGFQWNRGISDPEKLREEKEETKKRAERALDLVKKGQEFKDVAKKFSDLPSASDGGDLGILQLEDMAPAMRTAVASLKTGEISQIILTAEDYQFFKRLSATDQATSSSYEKAKEEIKEKLYEEKLKAAYSDWVKGLKENAYIRRL